MAGDSHSVTELSRLTGLPVSTTHRLAAELASWQLLKRAADGRYEVGLTLRRLGGDGEITPTERTAEQTDIGLFWGYDGSIGLGVPPRLYNQIARVMAMHEHHTTIENARLFALVNIAMADAGIDRIGPLRAATSAAVTSSRRTSIDEPSRLWANTV